jgi:hypothetical protein
MKTASCFLSESAVNLRARHIATIGGGVGSLLGIFNLGQLNFTARKERSPSLSMGFHAAQDIDFSPYFQW